MKKQVFNPYLPTCEYIPDGEPHVFGGRLYLYGSHDRFDGAGFCLNDYVCWSAPEEDLSDWRYEGVIYRKEQDPRNQNIPEGAPVYGAKPQTGVVARKPEDANAPGIHAMWAPDVVQGRDGRFYLYYCLDFLPEIAVAVCDEPAGAYEFLGLVRHADGRVLGTGDDLVQFDPGVFMDTDGTVYLYSGNSPIAPEHDDGMHRSQVMTLMDDMVTLKSEPRRLLPAVTESAGTGFEGHEFFEASSIRLIGDKYYFVYSSVRSHELCYAVSEKPDGGYRYGGTLVDIGDIFLNGRTSEEAVNPLGNTHGGIERCNGQWYVFYHRQTNRTNFSRQGCAEKIFFDREGRIGQAEVTSCGLNDGPLEGKGIYPASICCHHTAKCGAAMSLPVCMQMNYPYLTQDTGDLQPEDPRMQDDRDDPVQYIKNIQDGSTIGYKYFLFSGLKSIALILRGNAQGFFEVRTSPDGKVLGTIPADLKDEANWAEACGTVSVPDGTFPLYLTWKGTGKADIKQLILKN